MRGCHLVGRTWRPSAKERQNHPELPPDRPIPRAQLDVRLHEVQISDGLCLSLVTSLATEGAELADLYQHRSIPHAAKAEALASGMPSGCGFLITAGNPWPHGTRLA